MLVRHPKLHFCFAHAGGTYLLLLGQIRHGYNCRPNLVGITSREYPHRTLQKHQQNIWLDNLVHDPDLLQLICKKIGTERIVMGSNYSFLLGEMPVLGEMLANEQVRGFILT